MTLAEIPIRIAWTHPLFGPQCTEVVDAPGSITTSLASALPSLPTASIQQATKVFGWAFARELSRALRESC